MSAPLLFHGPGAREEALKVHPSGRIVWSGEPKKENLREMLSVLLSSLITTGPAIAVIGPLDQAASGAFDLLLKNLEELDSSKYKFILWVKDIQRVPLTILSRCRERYVYVKEEDSSWEEALTLYDAWKNGDLVTMSKMTETTDLVPSFVHVLASQGKDLILWASLREALQDKNFDADEFFALLAGIKS